MKAQYYNFFFLTVFQLGILALSFAGTTDPIASSLFDYLVQEEVVEMELSTDMSLLLDENNSGADYQAAKLTFSTLTHGEEQWDFSLKPRGKYRLRICDFPPLKFNFSKKDLAARGFDAFDKLKLVTHCDDDRLEGQEKLLREYLVYKMYETITPLSFRVHLIRIRYVDTSGKMSSFKRYAFLLEDVDELVARIGSTECEDCLSPAPEQINREAENIQAVFQYMVGNADYSLALNRNVKLVKGSATNPGLIPVGYDFDFSGMVDATYAVPIHAFGQVSVRDRVFLGLPVEDPMLERTLARFETHHAELLDLIAAQKLLSATVRFEMKAYLESFYAQIADLKVVNQRRTYTQLRQKAPTAVPDGGNPDHYGIGK
ncbi:MAG: hypothetical protein DA408_13715 [Bacteroidetes bacterium]|nr:MAG: hypothetical protein C7N36_04515 [Bacteroidota bacterium]PTM11377.1 MAG: hypothetical protein DA408_13715 [Bacteroidota bacterium]